MLGACDLLKGDENIDELCELMRTTEGIKFCISNHFPSTRTLRAMREYGIQRHGIFVDVGEIELTNPPTTVIIAGKSRATIEVNGNHGATIALVKGASAIIKAREWAVVTVIAEQGTKVIRECSDNAIMR